MDLFQDKIIYILLDKEPENLLPVLDNSDKYLGNKRLNTLKRIKLQYDSLSEGIISANKNDLIIVSDIDEIPNLDVLNNQIKNKILIFKQQLYYYKFNLRYPNYEWFGSKACRKKDLISFEWLKYIKNKKYKFFRLDTLFSKNKYIDLDILENGGWHFSKVKNEEDIFYLLSNFCLNTYQMMGFISLKIYIFLLLNYLLFQDFQCLVNLQNLQFCDL